MRIVLFPFALAIAIGIASNACLARVQPHAMANIARPSAAGAPHAASPPNISGTRSVQHNVMPGAGLPALHKSAIGGPVVTHSSTLGGAVAFRAGIVGGPMTTPLRHR